MDSLKMLFVVVVLALIGSACFAPDDTSAETIPHDDPASTLDDSAPTDAERPCEGGAFPDDVEFRELLCAMQWAQVDLVSGGGVLDPAWVTRSSEAILGYADDRAGAVVEIEAVIAEMTGAAPPPPPPAEEPDAATALSLGEQLAGVQDCMVEVARLIVEANVVAEFDPTRVEDWQERADAVEPLVDAGDLTGAEDLVCTLRDDIAAAIADPSLIPTP